MVLEGQVAMVTGGGQGIGRAIALRFAGEGADVAILDLNRETAEATARDVVALGRQAMVEVADVSDFEAVRAAVTDVVLELEKLDVLVNNAGVEKRAAFLDITPAIGNGNWTSICPGRSTALRRRRKRWRSGATGGS